MALTLTVVTPERALPPIACDHVTVVAVDGQLGVRPGHAALVGLLAGGFLQPRRGGRALPAIAIRGGVGQVARDQVLIITEAAVPAGQVDRAAVQRRLDALPAGTAHETERAFLRAQLDLPAGELSTDEMLSGAKAAIDAER